MNQSGVTVVETINDEKDYEELTNAMGILDIDSMPVFRLVAGIMHLGNVEFVADAAADVRSRRHSDRQKLAGGTTTPTFPATLTTPVLVPPPPTTGRGGQDF